MIQRMLKFFSGFAFLMGMAFFCVSLTPSLLPRPIILQGILSGTVFSVGYCFGVSVIWLWNWLQLPRLRPSFAGYMTAISTGVACIAAVLTLYRMRVWQNSIREIMEMELVQTTGPLQIVGIAFGVALSLIVLFRLGVWLCHRVIRVVAHVFPPRLAVGLGAFTFLTVVALSVDGFIVKRTLLGMDRAFAALDRTSDDDLAAPDQSARSGNPQSLIAWDSIGRMGKGFLSRGATAEDITAVTGRPAVEPVRIYAGFNTADTLAGRAEFALADLIHAGGFERSTLVIATATGTGWLDPAAVEPLVYLQDGDVAIATIQYSYLPSWLTLIVEPDRSRRAARALFEVVYAHWTALPNDSRPNLYLFGLSLGALGSESSVEFISQFEDPINGALWAGPPFASTVWSQVVRGRVEGSPAWRPVFRDGSLIRFMTGEDGIATPDDAQWGRMRLLYLQQPSDPMSFFSPELAFRKPDWLEDRGPDISPYFDWYPIVTFLQVMFDIPMATSVPAGYGHTFTPDSYIDAWLAILGPKDGWTQDDTLRIKDHFLMLSARPT